MAATAAARAAWAAGTHHLSALSDLATKLERLERQAELLDNLQEEEESQGYLKAFRGSSSPGGKACPHHRSSTSCLLSEQVSELKSYIQAVADAEMDGDNDMLCITASHAAKYAVQLVRQSTDMACMTSKAHQVVVDLAAATLSMLSQRPPVHEVVATAGAVPALLQLLDPLQSPCAVENAAKALGNLSADAACRALIRSSGGVGSLARLLRDDCAPSMQASAAAALSLLAARDPVVSDTLRYLGALPLLVDLLNSPNLTATEAARCCLLSLKHNNPRNASEILTCLRSNAELCKDYWRLKDALLLLGESPALPSSPNSKSPAARAHSPSPYSPALTCSPGSPTYGRAVGAVGSPGRCRSPVKAVLEAAVDDARREVAAAAVHVVEAIEEEVLQKKIRRAQQPLEALHCNLDASIALLKASLADTRAAAAASRASAAASAARSSSCSRSRMPVTGIRPGSSSSSDAPKSVVGKHVMCYTCDEVCSLLHRMGLDSSDTRPIKKANLSGAELLLLSEQQLVTLLDVPLHKARRLRKLQEAVALYDTIATRVAQPRLTEVELRLWLAAQAGCGCAEASRTIKLLKSLVQSDPDAHCCSAWEWAAGWTWVQHALEVHGISWRV